LTEEIGLFGGSLASSLRSARMWGSQLFALSLMVSNALFDLVATSALFFVSPFGKNAGGKIGDILTLCPFYSAYHFNQSIFSDFWPNPQAF
jgi:hypothetical protein